MGSRGDSVVSKIAFLFPGQGSQAIGMGKLAATASAKAAEIVRRADGILGFSLSQIMFEGPEDRLRDTAVTQPALFVASAAALELLKERGVSASWAAGHSLGEYSALYAAGVLTFENALKLVQERGRAMNDAAAAHPGAMAAVIGLDASKLETVCAEASSNGRTCVPANINSESQIVISGHAEAVKKAMELATAAGAAKVIPLNVSGAFHSSLMSSAASRMKTVIDAVPFSNAAFPIFTNVDAQPTTLAADFKRKLVEQIDHPVRWHDSMTRLIETGVEIYVEVGSGRVLSTMAKKLDRKKTVLATDDLETLDKTFASQTAK